MRLTMSAATLLLCACNSASSGSTAEPTGRTYPVPDFAGVVVAGPYDVIVTQGPASAVRAEGDPDSLDRLDIRVEDGNLVIGTKRRFSWTGSSGQHATVHVSAPRLERATIEGSGDLRIDTVAGGAFEAGIGGSGALRVEDLKVRSAKLSIAGSGDLSVAGSSERSDISIAGSGDVDAGTLSSRTVAIRIAGAGGVRARASESAAVSIMGSGDVSISGTENCTVSKLGSGRVRCTL